MVFVSFKNIYIWTKMARMPIFGHTFFSHYSAMFGQIWLIFYGSSADHYLSIGEIQVMMLIFNFWATFGGKMGVATTHASDGLGPPEKVPAPLQNFAPQ